MLFETRGTHIAAPLDKMLATRVRKGGPVLPDVRQFISVYVSLRADPWPASPQRGQDRPARTHHVDAARPSDRLSKGSQVGNRFVGQICECASSVPPKLSLQNGVRSETVYPACAPVVVRGLVR